MTHGRTENFEPEKKNFCLPVLTPVFRLTSRQECALSQAQIICWVTPGLGWSKRRKTYIFTKKPAFTGEISDF